MMRNSQATKPFRKLATGFLAALLCIGALTASLPAQRGEKPGDSNPTPETWINWSNYSCKAVNDSSDGNLTHITTDNELKLNYTPTTTSTQFAFANNANPSRTLVGPQDMNNSITTQRSGNTLTWSSTKAIAAIIIGAPSGNPGRVYWYTSGGFGDSGLQNPNGVTISSVNFCYYQPAKVTIIKVASPFNGSGASTTSFPFTSTNFVSPSTFALVDNNSQPADRKVSGNLYKFAKLGSSNWVTVTESLVNGWSLSDMTCTDTDTVSDQQQFANVIGTLSERKVTIKLEEGEHVTCTFSNVQLQPSAGTAKITGRIATSEGRGISGAIVTLTNPSTGSVWSVRTNTFGYYEFDGLEVADLYFLSASHKLYRFTPDTRTFTLDSDLDEQDFVASR